MSHPRIFILLVLILSYPAFAQRELNTIAVLPFNIGWDSQDTEIFNVGFPDALATNLARIQGIRVVERTRLSDIINEHKLNLSGIVDENSASQVGRLLGADGVVIGDIHKYGSAYRVFVRLVLVETGEIYNTVEARKTFINDTDIFDLQDEVSSKFISSLNIVVSEQQRQNLIVRPTKSISAFSHYSKGLKFADQGNNSKARDEFRTAVQIDPKYEPAKDKLTYYDAIMYSLYKSGKYSDNILVRGSSGWLLNALYQIPLYTALIGGAILGENITGSRLGGVAIGFGSFALVYYTITEPMLNKIKRKEKEKKEQKKSENK